MVAATLNAFSPKKEPAATTAPVASIVPPIHAPPNISGIPTALINTGMITIMIEVKIMDNPMAVVSSSFLALHAAAVAMAAETPHTAISALTVIFKVLDPIFKMF